MTENSVPRGRGEPYTEEENAAIMAGPSREPTKELQARLIAAGYPHRTIDALKAQKKVLRYRVYGETPKRKPMANRTAALGTRYDELANELASLEVRKEECLTELKAVSLAMVRVGLGLDGNIIPPEVQDALREYIETVVTTGDGE